MQLSKRRTLLEILKAKVPPVDSPESALAEHRVFVNGAIVTNPQSLVRLDDRVTVKPERELQGFKKLTFALNTFAVNVNDCIAVDLGACTGGFTLALLQNGARHVYAVDVGFGQLLGSLQQDDRVTSLERTNLGDVTPQLLGGHPDVIVADITKLTLREVGKQLVENDVPHEGSFFIGLVKPMFELAMGELPTSSEELNKALNLAADGLAACGWEIMATAKSPVRGHNGAVEFFVLARWPKLPGVPTA